MQVQISIMHQTYYESIIYENSVDLTNKDLKIGR